MAINVFKMKKIAAIVVPMVLSFFGFFLAAQFYGVIIGFGAWFVFLIVSYFLGSKLLTNPFTQMLEGKGLLAINLDSTGILRPFIVGVKSPYIGGNYQGQEIDDVFDRKAVFQMAVPKVAGSAEPQPDGGIKITVDENEFNNSRFAMFHYPVLIWNDQLKSLITKEQLSKNEMSAFAEHSSIHLLHVIKDTNKHLRDFGRYVVDQLKPGKSLFANRWVWIVVIILLVVLGVMFLPAIVNTFGGVASTVNNAASTSVISPR